MYRSLVGILCLALTVRAHADCENDSAQIRLALTPEALAVRDALHSQLCTSGEVYDLTDPGMKERLTEPRDIQGFSVVDADGIRGNLLLAFAVDPSGSIQQITVLVSSGQKKLDAKAVAFWSKIRFKTPSKLDGQPVRILTYFRFKSIVNGK